MKYIYINNDLLEDESLSVYEKMCLIALSKIYQMDEEKKIDFKSLAKIMGTKELEAKGAFYSLKNKNFLISTDNRKKGKIIKAKEFKSDLKNTDKENVDKLVEELKDIIDEPITNREAKIILSFGNNDISKIKEKYEISKKSKRYDTVEVLILELQKKEKDIELKDSYKEDLILDDEKNKEDKTVEEKKKNTQINSYKLNLMNKYKNINK